MQKLADCLRDTKLTTGEGLQAIGLGAVMLPHGRIEKGLVTLGLDRCAGCDWWYNEDSMDEITGRHYCDDCKTAYDEER